MNPSLLPQDFEDACVDNDACSDSGARAPTHHPYAPGDHSSRNAPPPSTTVPKTLASVTLSLRGSGASLGAGAIKLLGVAYTGAGAVSRVPAADSELHAPKSSGGFTTPPSICLLPATAVAHPSFDAIMGEGEQLMSCRVVLSSKPVHVFLVSSQTSEALSSKSRGVLVATHSRNSCS